MQREIGSWFWLQPNECKTENVELDIYSALGFNGNDYVWLSSGRSAISYVLDTIEFRNPKINKIACVPAFTCHTVFEPFIKAGYHLETLPINFDLTSNACEVKKRIVESGAKVVLFHRYFGVDTLPEIDSVIAELRNDGIIVIEDCTQSLYSNINRLDADYYVGSIRKWSGVPDGGFAICKEGSFVNKPIECDKLLERVKTEASLLKYDYLINGKGEKDDFLLKYSEAEGILGNQQKYYKISSISLSIQSQLNIKSLKENRVSNFVCLLNGFKDFKKIRPIFNDLSNGIIPLYFPIYFENRADLQKLLIENSIYAPVVWPKDEACPKINMNAEYIYNHILCIPIDQRYDESDMIRIINVINGYFCGQVNDTGTYKEQTIV